MAAALLMAGGRSQRAGRQHKSCRTLFGKPITWIDLQVDRLRAAGFAPIIVVTGYRPRRLRACLHRRVIVRHHFTARRGPFSTIQRGLRALDSSVLIVQTDTVLPPVPVLQSLRRSVRRAAVCAASLRDRLGHGGHPLMLSAAWAKQLGNLAWSSPDARLDLQLRPLSATQYIRVGGHSFYTYPPANTLRQWRSARRLLRNIP
ncbi:MAG: NTP transferase domain-containing protein [Acidithiobacillus sp.]